MSPGKVWAGRNANTLTDMQMVAGVAFTPVDIVKERLQASTQQACCIGSPAAQHGACDGVFDAVERVIVSTRCRVSM